MNDIFVKTQALGEALLESSEYKAMREAEEAVRNDESASLKLEQYGAHKHALETLFQQESPDADAVRLHTESMQSLQKELNDTEIVAAMNDARRAFSQVIQQVNQVLQFMITGEMESGGCGGNCSGCSGCH